MRLRDGRTEATVTVAVPVKLAFSKVSLGQATGQGRDEPAEELFVEGAENTR